MLVIESKCHLHNEFYTNVGDFMWKAGKKIKNWTAFLGVVTQEWHNRDNFIFIKN